MVPVLLRRSCGVRARRRCAGGALGSAPRAAPCWLGGPARTAPSSSAPPPGCRSARRGRCAPRPGPARTGPAARVVRPNASLQSWSSMPITDRSSGTRSPSSAAASSAPNAISSDPAKIAVGRSTDRSIATAATFACGTMKPPSAYQPGSGLDAGAAEGVAPRAARGPGRRCDPCRTRSRRRCARSGGGPRPRRWSIASRPAVEVVDADAPHAADGRADDHRRHADGAELATLVGGEVDAQRDRPRRHACAAVRCGTAVPGPSPSPRGSRGRCRSSPGAARCRRPRRR